MIFILMFTSVSKAQSRGPTWQALCFFLASIANFVVTRQTDTEVGEEGRGRGKERWWRHRRSPAPRRPEVPLVRRRCGRGSHARAASTTRQCSSPAVTTQSALGSPAPSPKEEATAQGHDLRRFRYGCAGYSMFVDNRDGQGGESEGKTLLPYCRGLELLVDSRLVERKPSATEQAPAHVAKDAATIRSHQQGQQRPQNLSRQEFLDRFKRSAGLVASGVAKNLNKTANYIKENIQDMYTDRRPPK
uniref:DUF8204 domain-containing protein n=1 Tax=Zea mays TaxID=4577 RepID=A0A804QD48_MAIZE